MEHSERVEAVAREFGALHAAVGTGPLTATVPTCPDWTERDLALHVGEFCGFWTHVLCDGTGRHKTPFPDPPSDPDALVAWLGELGDHLVAELRATPESTALWTWHKPDQSARFVARRCANELAVHRYDAESARGPSRPIEPALAADGIDEVFDALVTARRRTGQPEQTMHLHGTDKGVAAEWLVRMHPDRIDVDRTHAKGDLALRGSASDLVLLLYGRPTLGPVDRFGDGAVLTRWYEEFVF